MILVLDLHFMIHQLLLLHLTFKSSPGSSYFEPLLQFYYKKGLAQPLMDLDFLLASVVDSALLPTQKDRQKVPRPEFLHPASSSFWRHQVPARPIVPADNTIVNWNIYFGYFKNTSHFLKAKL